MTRHLTTTNLNNFLKHTIGIDNFFEHMMPQLEHMNAGNYPPYNIVKVTDDKYEIEVAVAGFNKDEISVTTQDGQLIIKGEHAETEETEEKDYLHRGISARQFERTFALADHVEVKTAAVDNGVLRVQLEREVPENLKPKQIEVK